MTVKEELLALAGRIEEGWKRGGMPITTTTGVAAELRRIADGLGDLPDTEWEWGTARIKADGRTWACIAAPNEDEAREKLTQREKSAPSVADPVVLVHRTPETPAGPWLPVEDTEK